MTSTAECPAGIWSYSYRFDHPIGTTKHDADFFTFASLSRFEAAKPTWRQQASNLSALMEESR